jgi:hypothetical protein
MRKNFFLKHGNSLLMILLCLAGMSVWAQPAALPQAVVSAHTLYVENETGFAELQYVTILELNKWGHFDLAESREKADLILRLDNGTHVRVVPEGEVPSSASSVSAESAVPAGYTRIGLLDPKTGQLLWSDVHKTEGGKVRSGHLLDGLREAFHSYEKGKR